MRLSRHCYDKPRRCPGWAGGGFSYAEVQTCDNGSIQLLDDHTGSLFITRIKRNWSFHRCDTCDVVCWPIVVRWLDYRWWQWWLTRNVRWKLEEHVLWPLQKVVVLGLYTRPLRFGTLALKLDQRWKTNVWEFDEEKT